MEIRPTCLACIGSYSDSNDRNKTDFRKLFRFPKDPVVREKWAKFCGGRSAEHIKDHHRICAGHFVPTDFRHLSTDHRNINLNTNAVPTLANAVSYVVEVLQTEPKNCTKNEKSLCKSCVICGPVNENVACFKFPDDVGVAKQWAKFCNLPISEVGDVQGLCQIHFKKSDFVCDVKGRHRVLRGKATPSLAVGKMNGKADSVKERRATYAQSSNTASTNESFTTDVANEGMVHTVQDCHQDIVIVDLPECNVNDFATTPSESSDSATTSDEEITASSNDNEFQINEKLIHENYIAHPCNASANNSSSVEFKNARRTYFSNPSNRWPRYLGDIKPDDFHSPERVKYIVDLAKKNVSRYQVTIRKLKKENSKLRERLIKAIETIEDMKAKRNRTWEDDFL